MSAAHGIRITKLTVPVLNTNFATPVVADYFLCRLLSRTLSVVHTTCALCVPGFHCPITSMLNNVAVIL
jgi:hypothetical protein